MKCIICSENYDGYGHNAEPIANGQCCDDCNHHKVIQTRITLVNYDKQNKIEYKYRTNVVEISIQGKFAGDVTTTYDDTGTVYAFTAIAHLPSGETVSRDFVVENNDQLSARIHRIVAIQWVEVQHCYFGLEKK